MPEHLIEGLKRFKREAFPRFRDHYRHLVEEGQSPSTLFIGCSDSRVVPDLLLDTEPGSLFTVRNAGNFVPPADSENRYPATAAAIEYAVIVLNVTDIVVCGHTHCGAVRALYDEPGPDTPHIARWLDLGRDARVEGEPSESNLRRSEQRSVALQLDHLLTYPIIRERAEAGRLSLHGWHYVIEKGEVYVLDVDSERFVPIDAQ